MPAFKRPSAPSTIDTRRSTSASDKITAVAPVEGVQSPPTSPVPLHTRAESRDARAVEHDRQRYFKTLERARTKARKAFGIPPEADASPQDAAVGGKKPAAMAVTKHHGAKERSVDVGDEKEFWGVAAGDVLWSVEPKPVVVVAAETAQVEVKLADLVQTRVKKGGKRGGGLGGEYEVVPHVRSVIVLDEEGRDMDVEEAWEYIDAGDEKPTYATIAAAGMD